MKRLTITLSNALYDELVIAAADSCELDEHEGQPTVEEYATECVASVLATRRLERICA
jgi:hypothetical protein